MSTVPAALVEAVAKAVEKLSRPGIEGWGLRVSGDMEGTGELLDLGPHVGCTSDACHHVSHDPAAPRRRWVPLSGRIVELGADTETDEVCVRYFAHIDGEAVRYIRVTEPRFYHAEARYIGVDDVPEWALASLASPATA